MTCLFQGITYFYRGQILDSGFLQFEQRLEDKFSCYYSLVFERLTTNEIFFSSFLRGLKIIGLG